MTLDDTYPDWANYRLENADAQGSHAIVALHGLGADLDQLTSYLSANVGGRRAQTLFADARDHGNSFPPERKPLNFEQAAMDAWALVDRLGFAKPLVLVGMSMGAATSITTALSRPERIAGLVLIRPAWLDEPYPPNLRVFPEIAGLLHDLGPDEGERAFVLTERYRSVHKMSPSVAASLRSQFAQPAAVARAHRLVELPSAIPFADSNQLLALETPCLVVEAPDDPVHPASMARRLARGIPGAKQFATCSRDRDPDRYVTEIHAAVDQFLELL